MKHDLDKELDQYYRANQNKVQVPPVPPIEAKFKRRGAREEGDWKGALLAAVLVAVLLPLSLVQKESPELGRIFYQTSQDQRAIQAGKDLTLRFIEGIQLQFKRSES